MPYSGSLGDGSGDTAHHKVDEETLLGCVGWRGSHDMAWLVELVSGECWW